MDRIFKSKIFIIVCIIALFLLGFMLFSFSGNDKANPVSDFVGVVFTPIQKAFTRITENGGNVVKSLTEYESLKKENEKLKDELAKSINIIAKSEKSIYENEELKKMLNIKETRPDFHFAIGQVVSKSDSGWDTTFTIDKGRIDGVNVKDAVMTPQGLVGYISEVGSTWAKVTVLTNPDCAVGAVVARTQEVGVVEGDLALEEDGKCKLAYMEKGAKFSKGDIVQTSGIGGIFPSGIAIGRISEIKPEPHGISTYGVVEPFVDIDDLKTVFVVTSFEGEKEINLDNAEKKNEKKK